MEILGRQKCKTLCKDAGLTCPRYPEGIATDYADVATRYYKMAAMLNLGPRRFNMSCGIVVVWQGKNPIRGNEPEQLFAAEGAR